MDRRSSRESYLEARLANAANAARRAEAFDQFHWYLEQYRALRWATALTRLNLSISLPLRSLLI
jgi:hypothetical protein